MLLIVLLKVYFNVFTTLFLRWYIGAFPGYVVTGNAECVVHDIVRIVVCQVQRIPIDLAFVHIVEQFPAHLSPRIGDPAGSWAGSGNKSGRGSAALTIEARNAAVTIGNRSGGHQVVYPLFPVVWDTDRLETAGNAGISFLPFWYPGMGCKNISGKVNHFLYRCTTASVLGWVAKAKETGDGR